MNGARRAAGIVIAALALHLLPLLAPGRSLLDGGWTWELALYRERLRDGVLSLGRVPLWDPYHAGGLPFLAEMHNAVFYPPTWLAVALGPAAGIFAAFLLHVAVAAAGAWRLARVAGARAEGAAAAALVFALGGYLPFQRWAGAHDVLGAAAWYPLLLSFLHEGVAGRGARAWLLAGVVAALLALAGRPGIPVYAAAGAAVYVAVLAGRGGARGAARAAAGAALAAAFAGLLALPYLVSVLEYLPRTARAAAPLVDAGAHEWPPWFVPTLAAPYLLDERPGLTWSHVGPWARTWIGGAAAGLLVAGFRRIGETSRPARAAHVAAAAVGLLLAMGPAWTPLPAPPGVRGAARALFVPLASLASLVGLSLDAAAAAEVPVRRRRRAALGVVAGVALTISAPAIAPRLEAALRSAASLRRAVRAADEAAHDRARTALEAHRDRGASSPTEADRARHAEGRREGALLRTLRRAGARGLPSILRWGGLAVALAAWATALGPRPVHALLLVAVELVAMAAPYVLAPRPPPTAPDVPAALRTPAVRLDGPTYDLLPATADGLHIVGTGGPLVAAPYAAWRRRSGAGEALRVLPRFHVEGGDVRVVAYEPDRWRLAVEAPASALLVALDAHDPWWTAEVDGAPADVVAVERTFLGVPVPAGRHDVLLAYRPRFVAAAAVAAAVAGFAGLAALRRRAA